MDGENADGEIRIRRDLEKRKITSARFIRLFICGIGFS